MNKKEVDYSTIRIKNSLRLELDSLKIESESYSLVIANIIRKNKELEAEVEELKADKKELFRLLNQQ